MSTARANWHAARRTRIFDLAIAICLADIVCGVAAPTFTVYARGLGASLVLVGLLTTVSGLTRLFGSIPIGVLSDHVARGHVISAGIFSFAAAYLLFTVSRDPLFLILPRILFGLGALSTFGIGTAYIADRTSGKSRNLAISAYVSAQGIGYGIGPFLAGAMASQMTTTTMYRLTAALAALTGVYTWRRLDRRHAGSAPRRQADRRGWSELVREPTLLGVSLGNLVIMLMFNGSVVPFLAVVGGHFGLGRQKLALLYGGRALASTFARLPAGYLARRISNRTLFITAMAVDATAAAAIGLAPSVWFLVGAAIFDGVAFGAFLGTSQSFIAEGTAASGVGAWLGVYSAAGAIGETVGGAAMGGVAALLGGLAVFRVAALLLALGVVVSWLVLASARNAAAPALDPTT